MLGGNEGGWEERGIKVREQVQIICLRCICAVIQSHKEEHIFAYHNFNRYSYSTTKAFSHLHGLAP